MIKSKDNPPKNDLVNEILNRYQPKTVDEMQDALKDIFGAMFERDTGKGTRGQVTCPGGKGHGDRLLVPELKEC